jgi:hypothetical protein
VQRPKTAFVCLPVNASTRRRPAARHHCARAHTKDHERIAIVSPSARTRSMNAPVSSYVERKRPTAPRPRRIVPPSRRTAATSAAHAPSVPTKEIVRPTA